MAGTLKLLSPPAGADGASTKRRVGVAGSVVVDTSLANCDVVDIQDYNSIGVKPSAGITTLSLHASTIASGTFVLIDSFGTAGAVGVTASKWNGFDVTKFPFPFIKMLPNTNGTVDVVGKT